MPCHLSAPPCSSVFSFSPMSKSAIGSPLFLLFVSLLLFLLLLRASVRPGPHSRLPSSFFARRSFVLFSVETHFAPRAAAAASRKRIGGTRSNRSFRSPRLLKAAYSGHVGRRVGGGPIPSWMLRPWSVRGPSVVCSCKFAPYVMGESCGLAHYGIVLTGKSKLNDDAVGNETLFVFPTIFAVIPSQTFICKGICILHM